MLVNLNGVETLYYGYTDNQGSLIALTDASGNVVEKYAYDPWGARRNPNDWTQNDSRTAWITNRGYTGHEHLDMFNIINMNGRVYDPLTAQFFSPDPFIQSGSDWKNYNRYSYCMNNPTRNTDPSGYMKEPNDDRQPKLMPASCYYYGSQIYHPQTGGSVSGGYSYRYDWGARTYTDSQGNFVATNEVVNNYINPNLGSASEDDVVNLLSSLKSESGLNVYSVKFSSGYTSYAASVGDIGQATIDYNGGLSFSNSTAGMISMSMWGGSGESGNYLESGLINHITNPAVDFFVGATEYKVGQILSDRGVYGKLLPETVIRTSLANINVSTKFLQTTGRVLKGTGVALGVAGIGMTAYEIGTGQKNLIGEGGLDLIMGGVGFIPGGGWIVSGAYFGGKALLESTGNDFWNQ